MWFFKQYFYVGSMFNDFFEKENKEKYKMFKGSSPGDDALDDVIGMAVFPRTPHHNVDNVRKLVVSTKEKNILWGENVNLYTNRALS